MNKSDAGGAAPGEITRALVSWRGGDPQALERLMPIVYRELRRLAAAYLRRERRDHTLEPTALVHEAYLRLVRENAINSQSRSQFYAIAANLMREILVNHAKRHRSAKRGGGRKESLQENAVVVQPSGVDVLALNDALNKLASLDPRKSQVVEMRFFAGLGEQEIAEALSVSTITIKRDWRVARAFLHEQLGGGALE